MNLQYNYMILYTLVYIMIFKYKIRTMKYLIAKNTVAPRKNFDINRFIEAFYACIQN